MSIPIIQERTTITGVSYYLDFEWRNGPGSGFSFDCDSEGTPDWNKYDNSPCAMKNLRGCLCGEFDVVFMGVGAREWSFVEAKIGRCFCGTAVYLDRFTNTCTNCGTDYNGSGQQLAPRNQWGAETGEHWTDCY